MDMNSKQQNNTTVLLCKAQGAFVGAAVGDALGWPQENRSMQIGSKNQPSRNFNKWTRRSGGRYFPYLDEIPSGHYSDDTQLLISTARSISTRKDWWHHFAYRELPFWHIYERGGGGATKRAASSWLEGKEPWDDTTSKAIEKYFAAGGNGVAMRIMPHCLQGYMQSDFMHIAQEIMTNGICTHGHPRALVGALSYGYAIWQAFKLTGTLSYGALIDLTLSAAGVWGSFDCLHTFFPTWEKAISQKPFYSYRDIWLRTVNEMIVLLQESRDAFNSGALAVERDVLSRLGCFSSSMSGAGTIAAAAAIFLASRYAANPLGGVLEAAFAEGIDTDTIASMTAALLGAIAGIEWLGDLQDCVQDAAYLKNLGEIIANNKNDDASFNINTHSHITKKDNNQFISILEISNIGDFVLLPIGVSGKVKQKSINKSLSVRTLSRFWEIETVDGQSFYITKISRVNKPKSISTEESSLLVTASNPIKINESTDEIARIRIKLPVRNIFSSRRFFEEIIGLKVTKENTHSILIADIIMLVPATEYHTSNVTGRNDYTKYRSFVAVDTISIRSVYQNMLNCGVKILSQIKEVNGALFFRCIDPDGNIIEIFERKN